MSDHEEYPTYYLSPRHAFLIGSESCDAPCQQGFFVPENCEDCDFCQDTSTWD